MLLAKAKNPKNYRSSSGNEILAGWVAEYIPTPFMKIFYSKLSSLSETLEVCEDIFLWLQDNENGCSSSIADGILATESLIDFTLDGYLFDDELPDGKQLHSYVDIEDMVKKRYLRL